MANESKLPTPVDWDELYPGRFIKAGDFKGKVVTLKISAVQIDKLVGDKGEQVKGVLSFEKTEKQLALNKTNGICLKAMFGRQVQEWVGKRVSLFAGNWNGEPAIRVHGSPDIPEDKAIEVSLPRKRPFNMVMHKVNLKGDAPAATQASAERAPATPQSSPAASPASTSERPRAHTGIDDDIPF